MRTTTLEKATATAGVALLIIAAVWPDRVFASEIDGFSFYGQINQGVMSYDDGIDNIEYGRVDNAVGDQPNRFGLNSR